MGRQTEDYGHKPVVIGDEIDMSTGADRHVKYRIESVRTEGSRMFLELKLLESYPKNKKTLREIEYPTTLNCQDCGHRDGMVAISVRSRTVPRLRTTVCYECQKCGISRDVSYV